MIIRGGTVVTARGVERADIAVAGGVITEVGPDLNEEPEELDASGLHVFPGGIDSHVHFNEPGRTDWEDIAHGSAALAAGGYTAFIDMPLNNLPVTTTVEAFDLKIEAMRRFAKVDYGLWGGLVPGNLNQLEPLVRRGVMGFKAFMCPSGIDEFPMCDEKTLRKGMERIAELDSILLVHAEDPSLIREPNGPTAKDFIESRPADAEVSAMRLAIQLSNETGCRLHVVHVSTARGAMLLEGDVTFETCPHYMLYTEDDAEKLGGLAKCAPPLRTAGDRDFMWRLQIVVSDHSPSTPALKQGDDIRKIWGGVSGCQSTRQLLLAHDRLELRWIAAYTATNIANRFRITGKGDIRPGFDADLWIVDLSHEDFVRREELLYKNPFSVHEGQPMRGRTVKTLVRGNEADRGRSVTQRH